MAKTRANASDGPGECRKVLLEVLEAGQCRVLEIIKERAELRERIESLKAEQAKLSDEWDDVLRRDSAICEEIGAADIGSDAHA